MVDIPILLVIAALGGAGLNVARGALQESIENFNFRKAAGGLITAAVASLAAVQILDVSTLGTVALVTLGLLTGFSADFAFSKLKK